MYMINACRKKFTYGTNQRATVYHMSLGYVIRLECGFPAVKHATHNIHTTETVPIDRLHHRNCLS